MQSSGTQHRALLDALFEASSSDVDGEVVVRSGQNSGRVYTFERKIAWATASTIDTKLSDYLVARNMASRVDLDSVRSECKNTGANFAETLIDWGIIERTPLRAALLDHILSILRELLGWGNNANTLFLPCRRVYQGTLTYSLHEVLATIAEASPEFSSVVLPYMSRIATQCPSARVFLESAVFAAAKSELESPLNEERMSEPSDKHEGTARHEVMSDEFDATLLSDLPPLSDIPSNSASDWAPRAITGFGGKFSEFRNIYGYNAAALAWEGHIACKDELGDDGLLSRIFPALGELDSTSNLVCRRLDFGSSEELDIRTESKQILYRHIETANGTVHFLIILTADGNHARARLEVRMALEMLRSQLEAAFHE